MLKAVIGGLALGALAIWWGRRAAAGIQDGIDGLTVDAGGRERGDAARPGGAGETDRDSIPDAMPAF